MLAISIFRKFQLSLRFSLPKVANPRAMGVSQPGDYLKLPVAQLTGSLEPPSKVSYDIHSPLVTSDLALTPDLYQHCPARGGAELSGDAEPNRSYLVCAQDFARKLLSPIDQIAFSL